MAGAMVLGGCSSAASSPSPGSSGPAASPAPQTAVPATSAAAALPQITVRRSGGLAGVQDTVVVAPQGAWTVTNRAGGRTTGQLSAAQVAEISVLATDPRLAAEAQRAQGPSRCSDAFTYVLTVDTARVSYVACPADSDQPPATVALVGKVMQFATPAPD